MMKWGESDHQLNISEIQDLSASNAGHFRHQVCARLSESHKVLEIELSQTLFLDSCGLGALIALWKILRERSGIVRLLNPSPPVQQILKLTHMNRIFEIRSDAGWISSSK